MLFNFYGAIRTLHLLFIKIYYYRIITSYLTESDQQQLKELELKLYQLIKAWNFLMLHFHWQQSDSD